MLRSFLSGRRPRPPCSVTCPSTSSVVPEHDGRRRRQGGQAGSAAGLRDTLLVFLIPLTAAGLLALLATRTYPRDVATARASIRAMTEADDGAGDPPEAGDQP